ncbi:response regulator transcription factor [Brotaphodocola sp.]|uniref:response regulator transcription factor n=1 Tax=Brotaphodocola sp. TaxID=3073577 RepID=UPI003D7DE121
MNDKVLIVDDDPAICKLLEKVMHSNDLDTDVADCGASALALLARNSGSYALVLLDVMLGDMEGFEVIKQMRSQGIKTPVIIVSGRSEDYDSLYGLSIGADDYITKPFRPLVLGAKVKALIRRNKDLILNHSDVLECGPFSYHSSTMRFYRNGEELILSARESAILLLFLRHPNQVFTKEMIYEQVWGNSVIVDDNAIMVYINRLRSKIEDDKQKPRHIVTVRGLGYRFVP